MQMYGNFYRFPLKCCALFGVGVILNDPRFGVINGAPSTPVLPGHTCEAKELGLGFSVCGRMESSVTGQF